MNAIEIKDLSKSFRGMYAVDHLNMTVPVGSIYGFIGENGSGKSTTMKLLCGHLVPDGGKIKLFGKKYTDPGVRVRVGALIENAGCFPGSSVYQNLMMQCINLGIDNADEEIQRVLKIVRMEDNAKLKFKSCFTDGICKYTPGMVLPFSITVVQNQNRMFWRSGCFIGTDHSVGAFRCFLFFFRFIIKIKNWHFFLLAVKYLLPFSKNSFQVYHGFIVSTTLLFSKNCFK